MSFGIYAIGFAILIGGLVLPHMPANWMSVAEIEGDIEDWK